MSNNGQLSWTPTGASCYHSNVTCAMCPIFVNYGLAAEHPVRELRCHQPQANRRLLEQGIRPPVDDKKAERLVKAINGAFSVFDF